jgi:hypothetical protein
MSPTFVLPVAFLRRGSRCRSIWARYASLALVAAVLLVVVQNSTMAAAYLSEQGAASSALIADTPVHGAVWSNSLQTAPAVTDERFVADRGGDLDQYLFREDVADGRLRFQIPITRIFFQSGANLETLVAAGLMPEKAVLLLRAFDVDESASPCPERDHIFVNGNQVYTSRGPAYLTGANGTWSAVQYEIPITHLRFPAQVGVNGNPPTPALNEIAIEINVLNCVPPDNSQTSSWAVAIDWGAIEIREAVRPFIMAHGWNGSTDSFNHFINLMNQHGIPHAGTPDLQRGIQPLALTGNLFALATTKAAHEFGVERLNILAHSKGGVVTRQALLAPAMLRRAHTVATYGSPHHGVGFGVLRDVIEEGQCRSKYESAEDRQRCRDAADELSVPAMREFNYSGCRRNLLGQWRDCVLRWRPPASLPFRTYIGDRDLIGSRNQATLPWNADRAPFPSEGIVDHVFPCTEGYGGCHNELLTRDDTFCRAASAILPRLNLPQCNGTVFTSAETTAITRPPDIDGGQETFVFAGDLTVGATTAISLPVEATSLAIIHVWAAEEPATFQLLDSAGSVVGPGDSYGTSFSAGADATYGWLAQYRVPTPQSGEWRAILSAATATPYAVGVSVVADLTLATAVNSYANQVGETLVIEAAFVNAGEVVSSRLQLQPVHFVATLTRPDGNSMDLVLNDEGRDGDQAAGDGVYAADVTSTDLTGFYRLQVTGVDGSGRQRLEKNLAVVIDERATIEHAVAEFSVDENGDGFLDALVLDLPINVESPGHYTLLGTLKGNDGQTVAVAAYSSRSMLGQSLQPGRHVLSLRFEGSDIRAARVDGPYLLTHVVLQAENELIATVDQAADLYHTQPYRARQFEGERFLMQGGSDLAIDSDGNGLYDRLEIRLEIDFLTAGSYDINGRLVNLDGVEVGWSQTTVVVEQPGLKTLTLAYLGILIGGQRINGPYRLTDLNLFALGGASSAAIFADVYTTSAYHYSDFEGVVFGSFLPLIHNPSLPIMPGCVPDPPGETDNIDDARLICSDQLVTGHVSQTDLNDVYKIWIEAGQEVLILMAGTGGDADLFLYPPGTRDVNTDPAVAWSINLDNNEVIYGQALVAGYWYVNVFSYAGETNYELMVQLGEAGVVAGLAGVGEAVFVPYSPQPKEVGVEKVQRKTTR